VRKAAREAAFLHAGGARKAAPTSTPAAARTRSSPGYRRSSATPATSTSPTTSTGWAQSSSLRASPANRDPRRQPKCEAPASDRQPG
jgi:hypothetical protein